MKLVERSPLLSGLNYFKGQVLTRLKLRGHHSGSTALQKSTESAVRYAYQVVGDYVTYGAGGAAARLIGKDILEIGPGDNLGVALLLLARGARTVTCIDGFSPSSSSDHNAHIYAAIYKSLSDEERARIHDVITIRSDGTAELQSERLVVRYGVPIDAAVTPLPDKRYDIILSRAVLEHLENLEIGWKNMLRSLRPDGEMWHKVDFRCHDFFGKLHPLYFLTISDSLWDLISRPDPTLNRMRLPDYRKLTRDLSDTRCYITHIIGVDEFQPHLEHLVAGTHYQQRHLDMIQEVRPRLLKRFASYSDEDLLITGIFLACRGGAQ
jgi:SAM-dependent methyltransferase